MNHQDFLNKDMFYFRMHEGLPQLKKCRVFKIEMMGNNVLYYVNPYKENQEVNGLIDYEIDSFNCFEDHFEAAKCFNEAQDIFELKVKI